MQSLYRVVRRNQEFIEELAEELSLDFSVRVLCQIRLIR